LVAFFGHLGRIDQINFVIQQLLVFICENQNCKNGNYETETASPKTPDTRGFSQGTGVPQQHF
jgi:hypothetical protein